VRKRKGKNINGHTSQTKKGETDKGILGQTTLAGGKRTLVKGIRLTLAIGEGKKAMEP